MFENTYEYIKNGKNQNIEERISLLRSMIVDLNKLKNRSTCSLCGQGIDRNDVDETLKRFNDIIPEVENELVEYKRIRNEEFKKQRELERKQKEELDRKVDEYLVSNSTRKSGTTVKDEMKKHIRGYFKSEHKLPEKIVDDEIELWNAAILKVLMEMNKDDSEYDDLFFKGENKNEYDIICPWGLPREMVSCPDCGELYGELMCKNCACCSNCCTCDERNLVSTKEYIEEHS